MARLRFAKHENESAYPKAKSFLQKNERFITKKQNFNYQNGLYGNTVGGE